MPYTPGQFSGSKQPQIPVATGYRPGVYSGATGSGTAQTGVMIPGEGADREPGRIERGIKTAAEITAVPSLFRTVESAAGGKMPSGWDLLGIGLMGAGGLAAKAAKLPAKAFIKGVGLGALGGGVGEAALGPEAAKIAADIRAGGDNPQEPGRMRKLAALAVQMAPSVAGSVAMPLGLARAREIAGAARAKVVPFQAPEGVPALSPKLNPSQAAQVGGMQREWLGGRKLTAGQKQEFAAPRVETAAKDYEFRTARTGAAIEDTTAKLNAIQDRLKRLAESQAEGASGATSQGAGRAVSQRYSDLRDAATKAMGEADDALAAVPQFRKLDFKFQKPLLAAFKETAPMLKKMGATSSEVKLFTSMQGLAKKVGNMEDMIIFKRRLGREMKEGLSKIGAGKGDAWNFLEGKIYEKTKDALSAVKVPPAERAALDQWISASENYAKTKFSPEGQLMAETVGFKGRGLPLMRKGEEVSESIFGGSRNLSERMKLAAEKGLADPADLKRVAWAQFFEKVTKDGRLDPAALRRTVAGMDATDRQILFGGAAPKLEQAAKLADLVTYSQRYAPMTGASLPKLVPGMLESFAGKMGPLRNMIPNRYYRGSMLQDIMAPGVEPAIPLPRGSRAALGGEAAKTQAERQAEALQKARKFVRVIDERR